ncbi:lytic murein transglycosylase B [Zoogloea sp.]|uniref:lytic murein transglycosylase B n=1 Tax=Zoogloea sp. TaxID=49181 RepID=UPI0035B15ACA
MNTPTPRPGLVPLLLAGLLSLFVTGARAERYADRPEARQFIDEMSQKHGFDKDALTYLFRRAEYLPSVIKYISPPKDPGVRSWQRYRGRFIEPVRIKAGLAFWNRHEATIKAASDKYGVPEEIIVGIIGVETIYGRNTGNYQALSALSTLAFDYPRRAELFRGELEALLLMAREQHRDPLDYQGSYAGALGLPQFLPSSVRNYAVDFDGDGQIDLLNSPADAIGSVARYMQMHGWESGAPVAVRASLEAGANLPPLIANDINPAFDAATLASHGVKAADGSAPSGKAAFVELVTPGEDSEYWLGYQNFYVITRYNRSSFYAMSVFQLGEAVKAARTATQIGSRR